MIPIFHCFFQYDFLFYLNLNKLKSVKLFELSFAVKYNSTWTRIIPCFDIAINLVA